MVGGASCSSSPRKEPWTMGYRQLSIIRISRGTSFFFDHGFCMDVSVSALFCLAPALCSENWFPTLDAACSFSIVWNWQQLPTETPAVCRCYTQPTVTITSFNPLISRFLSTQSISLPPFPPSHGLDNANLSAFSLAIK